MKNLISFLSLFLLTASLFNFSYAGDGSPGTEEDGLQIERAVKQMSPEELALLKERLSSLAQRVENLGGNSQETELDSQGNSKENKMSSLDPNLVLLLKMLQQQSSSANADAAIQAELLKAAKKLNRKKSTWDEVTDWLWEHYLISSFGLLVLIGGPIGYFTPDLMSKITEILVRSGFIGGAQVAKGAVNGGLRLLEDGGHEVAEQAFGALAPTVPVDQIPTGAVKFDDLSLLDQIGVDAYLLAQKLGLAS